MVGSHRIAPNTSLAPLAGLTDMVFRRLVKSLGKCGLLNSEMIASHAMLRENPKTLWMMRYAEDERPFSMQIMGDDPAVMAEAARMVADRGGEIVDINMGCPVKKITRGGGGSALMRCPDKVAAILRAIRAAVSIPVTVKMRAGWDDRGRNAVEMAKLCEGEGAALIIVHPRTQAQKFRGRADWELIGLVKEAVAVPVLGNGDIRAAQDALRMMTTTGCDGVMIGRAALQNPWIFHQVESLRRGTPLFQPTPRDRKRLILAHFDLIAEMPDARFALHKLRKFAGWYSKGLSGSSAFRRRINEMMTLEEFRIAVEECLLPEEAPPPAAAASE